MKFFLLNKRKTAGLSTMDQNPAMSKALLKKKLKSLIKYVNFVS